MGKMVQIRNMPEKMHRLLKSRAAQAGMSLSEYLLRELKKSADRPTEAELWERIRKRAPAFAGFDAAEAIREGREERETQLAERLKDVRR
jgi:antitoxin FitA